MTLMIKPKIEVETENSHIIHPSVYQNGFFSRWAITRGEIFWRFARPRYVVDCPELYCGRQFGSLGSN